MLYRLGNSLVNGAACGHSILRTNTLRNRTASDLCRRGCGESETLEHVLLVCPCYSEQRARIVSICTRARVDFTVVNALTHPRLLASTESLFLAVHDDNYCTS